MKSEFKTKYASRGWHFYRKTQWKSPKKGQRLYTEKENDKIALMHEPYAVAWKMISQGKLLPETVGHVPKKLSRATWFFLMRGGKISGSVFEEKYLPSPIPKGGLEIMLEAELKIEGRKRKNLERYHQNIIENNYENIDNAGKYPIYDSTVINLQRENVGATPESLEDEDDEVICID